MEFRALIDRFKNMPSRPKIGLCLAGGAARGLSHIGVLQVFEEIGMPIDLIVGTSAGAIVGSLWASGVNSEKMHRLARKTEWWFLAKPALFDMGLLSSQGIEDWLERIIQVKEFKEMPIEFVATATDFLTGELVVLHNGDVAHAVRISCTIPGIYKPVRYQGRELVDGGLVQNLPAQVSRAFGAEILIGVDVHADLLGTGVPQTPVVALIHSANILQRQHEIVQLDMVDLIIEPKVGHLSPISFNAVDQFVEHGQAAARERLDELASLLGKVVGGN